MPTNQNVAGSPPPSQNLFPDLRRRSFLKYAGVSVALAATTLATRQLFGANAAGGVDLGSGDIGVLNYAYALEQLEAEFYTKVTGSYYSGISSQERSLLSDIHAHEVAHRQFLKGALGSAAIAALEFNFSSVNFHDRQSVLTTARTFEDTGVAAYNGAGQLLRDPGHLLAAGKIVSVEARHAATIREILAPHSTAFAGDDVVDAFGLGAVKAPGDVLKVVAPFVRTPINASNLPKA